MICSEAQRIKPLPRLHLRLAPRRPRRRLLQRHRQLLRRLHRRATICLDHRRRKRQRATPRPRQRKSPLRNQPLPRRSRPKSQRLHLRLKTKASQRTKTRKMRSRKPRKRIPCSDRRRACCTRLAVWRATRCGYGDGAPEVSPPASTMIVTRFCAGASDNAAWIGLREA